MASQRTFWLVWDDGGNPPRVKHWNEIGATREAERLARLNRGRTFVVLESVAARVVDDMQRVTFSDAPEDCDFPF